MLDDKKREKIKKEIEKLSAQSDYLLHTAFELEKRAEELRSSDGQIWEQISALNEILYSK